MENSQFAHTLAHSPGLIADRLDNEDKTLRIPSPVSFVPYTHWRAPGSKPYRGATRKKRGRA
jgi:hypothetical protein